MDTRERGQSLLEYSLLIGVVITALIAVQTYVRRALQARAYTAASINAAAPPQYEPYYYRAPGGVNNTTGESNTRTRTAANYQISSGKVTGSAITEVAPQPINDAGDTSYQREWPALP
jgi:uncharacterized protein (UPF0333 family)